MANSKPRLKNLHLAVSTILIFIIAVIYGFFPGKIVPALANLPAAGNDVNSALKAIMGLYVGSGIFWLLGMIQPQLWKGATIVNILFMFGLAGGRVLSMIIDGIPSEGMVGGTIIELIIGFWGVLSLRCYHLDKDKSF